MSCKDAFKHWQLLTAVEKLSIAEYVGRQLVSRTDSSVRLFRDPLIVNRSVQESAAARRCAKHFAKVFETLFGGGGATAAAHQPARAASSSASSSSSSLVDRSTALLAARHVGYGIRSQHYAGVLQLLLEALRSELASGDLPVPIAGYKAAFELQTSGIRATSKQLGERAPAVDSSRQMSRRKTILLHAFWEEIHGRVPRGKLTQSFYAALQRVAPNIHGFIAHRARSKSTSIDVFRQLFGALIAQVCVGATNEATVRVLFDVLTGVSSAMQYNVALLDATREAAFAALKAASSAELFNLHVQEALQCVFTHLDIQLARSADNVNEDDAAEMYRSAEQLFADEAHAHSVSQRVGNKKAGVGDEPATTSRRPLSESEMDGLAMLGLAPMDRRRSHQLLVLNSTLPRHAQTPTHRLSEHLLMRALTLVERRAVSSGRFGSSALHVCRLDADFALFVRDTRALHAVRVASFSHVQRLVFFLNLYHALALHVRILRADDQSLRAEHFRLFRYRIGSQEYSLRDIEHKVLRARSCAAQVVKMVDLSASRAHIAKRVDSGELRRAEPLVSFALSHCAASSPPLRVYRVEDVHEMLHFATREYLDANVAIVRDADADTCKLRLPRLLLWFAGDFAASKRALFEWLAAHAGEKLRTELATVERDSCTVQYRAWHGAFAFRYVRASAASSVPSEDPHHVLLTRHTSHDSIMIGGGGSGDNTPVKEHAQSSLARLESVADLDSPLTRSGSSRGSGKRGVVRSSSFKNDAPPAPLLRTKSVALNASGGRRASAPHHKADLGEQKRESDSELEVYLLTLRAKANALPPSARHESARSAIHRLQTVASEMKATPVLEYAMSPLMSAHDTDLRELEQELSEASSGGHAAGSRAGAAPGRLTRAVSSAKVRRNVDRRKRMAERTSSESSMLTMSLSASRDLLGSLKKLRAIRQPLLSAIEEYLSAVARRKSARRRLHAKLLHSSGTLSAAVLGAVRFVCRICERTLMCTGATFEQHSRTCALGHTLANDSRMSPHERLAKLLALFRARYARADGSIDAQIDALVQQTMSLPFGATERASALIGELRAKLADKRVSADASTLGYCMVELLSSVGRNKDDDDDGDDEQSSAAAASGATTSVTISDFKILKPISRGGYGTVFLATKRATGDLYAIKMMRKEDLLHKNVVEQALAERDIMAQSNNPFVVKLFYALETEAHLYLVMEFVIGGDCASLLENLGYFDEPMAIVYAAQIVCALEYLHARGIVHRDLKPENLLITERGHLVLTDFGLSSVGLDSESENDADSESTSDGDGSLRSSLNLARSALELSEDARWDDLTRSDVFAEPGGAPARVLGTPQYLAPEMILQQPHSFSVDWWALGVIVFEFLSGSTPFEDDTPQAIMRNILHAQIPWQLLPEEMSADARTFIAALLRRDVEKRIGSHGSHHVKRHAFFANVDWSTLVDASSGFNPSPDSATDTSYFTERAGVHMSFEGEQEQKEEQEEEKKEKEEEKDKDKISKKNRDSVVNKHVNIKTRKRSGSSPPEFVLSREFQYVNVNSLQQKNMKERRSSVSALLGQLQNNKK